MNGIECVYVKNLYKFVGSSVTSLIRKIDYFDDIN